MSNSKKSSGRDIGSKMEEKSMIKKKRSRRKKKYRSDMVKMGFKLIDVPTTKGEGDDLSK